MSTWKTLARKSNSLPSGWSTAEEIAARLERAAETMPPAVAARVVGVLRRRGLAG